MVCESPIVSIASTPGDTVTSEIFGSSRLRDYNASNRGDRCCLPKGDYMKTKLKKSNKKPKKPVLHVSRENAAGIDVGSYEIFVAVPHDR